MGERIKVFVAVGNGSELEGLARLIKEAPGFELVGTAKEPAGLIKKLIETEPKAILMDLDSFGTNPTGSIQEIMRLAPAPIILITAKKHKAQMAFEGISAGALTVLKKPSFFDLRVDLGAGAPLLKAIKMYSEVKVIRHVHGGADEQAGLGAGSGKSKTKLVAIASSTGGPQALRTILSDLPGSLPVGIVIAQHITQGFTAGLVEWLDKASAIEIKEPYDAEIIRPGIAYIAPDGYHMTVERGDWIHLDEAAPVKGHRPSCNRLLKSVAKIYGDKAIGVILSGMGDDGAEGLKEIRKAGGRTIAQDEKSCVVFGMPKVALEIGAVNRTTPLERIAWELIREFR